MASLERLFRVAQAEIPGLKLRRTKTQEVLDLVDARGNKVRGVAWRPLNGAKTLQIYPTSYNKTFCHEGDDFVVRNAKSEWRYCDPHHHLKEQFHYYGCNCRDLVDTMVWYWIRQANYNLRRDKGLEATPVDSSTINTTNTIANAKPTKTLTAAIPVELHDKFSEFVWKRFKSKKESYTKAMNTAVEIALTDLLKKY